MTFYIFEYIWTLKEDRPGVVAKFQVFADKGVYHSPLYK